MHELVCDLVLTGAMLCLQASMLQRIQALTSLLNTALAESEQHPERSLPGLAVTFAATQVQVSALFPFQTTLLPSCCHPTTHFCLLATSQTQISACLFGKWYSFLHGLATGLCATSLRACCGFCQVLVFVGLLHNSFTRTLH